MGELEWELLRVAPFVVFLKKNTPNVKIIILTRPERFDLYGMNADGLVPLLLENDREDMMDGHGIKGFDIVTYEKLVKTFYTKYSDRFKIIKHYYFDMSEINRKVRWQTKIGHTRDKILFSFKPRPANKFYVDKITKDVENLVYINSVDRDKDESEILAKYKVFDKTFYEQVHNTSKYETTFLGCFIELMKKCKFVVGQFDDPVSLLALLCKVPVIHLGGEIRPDSIKMLNPSKTPIIHCHFLKRGVTLYENNF
jgi:hypothetical protein